MSNPNALAGSALSLQGAGALMGAFGTFANTRARRDAAKANAAYAELQARDALERAGKEEQKHRRDVSQLRGQQRASLAARGVVLTEGSPLALLESTEIMGELDAREIREGGRREAHGRRIEAANYRAETDANNPWLTAGGSLLTSAGQVAQSYYGYRQRGIRPFGR